MTLNELIADLKNRFPDFEIAENEPMSSHITFRVGGPVPALLLPENEEQLSAAVSAFASAGIIPIILGNGSNVLVPDEGLSRPVICTRKMSNVTVDGNTVIAEAGCTMARMAIAAQKAGLTGLEFAHGIPGTVGGGAVMNAGAYGGELKDVVTEVRSMTLDGEIVIKRGAELDFSYRHSCFDDGNYIILSVTAVLTPGDSEAIRAKMDELAAKRRASQPLEWPSAGSTFKRPTGYFAGKLIQDCGLKGFSVGGAQVSEKHAGFVINKGGATCADIIALTDHIKAVILEQMGVPMELEVRLLHD